MRRSLPGSGIATELSGLKHATRMKTCVLALSSFLSSTDLILKLTLDQIAYLKTLTHEKLKYRVNLCNHS
jgi:hypothetical protein